MTAFVVAASGLAYALLAAALARQAPWPAALAASLLGLAWTFLHALRPRVAPHGLFFALALAGAGFVARGGGAPLGLGIVGLALVAWDVGTMRRILAHLPRGVETRWGRRYALQSVAVAALGATLGRVGLLVRPSLGFPAALGLSISAVSLLALALWQSGRARAKSGEPPPHA